MPCVEHSILMQPDNHQLGEPGDEYKQSYEQQQPDDEQPCYEQQQPDDEQPYEGIHQIVKAESHLTTLA